MEPNSANSFLSLGLLSQANLAYSCGKLEIFYQKLQTIEAYLGPGIHYELTETDKILFYGLQALKYLKVSFILKEFQSSYFLAKR